ncbi:MAG: hypothetical protein GXP55_16785 [Deltaproteobacteria bacterium]|nr:hypothetical protein [Deltaproteobacteria bacterium]
MSIVRPATATSWVALGCVLGVCACASPPAAPELELAHEAGTIPTAPLVESLPAAVTEPERRSLDAFLGEPDAPLLRSLRDSSVVDIERGRGGRSMGFKLTLADGTQGYFKPEQSFSGAHWYSEIAAYHLDRELGFGRVPVVTGRVLPWAPLRRAARGDARLREVTVRDGSVRGAFVWWIPGGLDALHLPDGWERWIRVQSLLPISPYQRPAQLRAALRRDAPPRPHHIRHQGPDSPTRPQDLSDLIVFDYLTSNVDRWGGGFTNVRVRSADAALVYLDNGAGFWPRARLGLMDRRLEALQRFRRSTIRALEDFDLDHYRQRLANDPLAPVLSEARIQAVDERRRAVLEHVRKLVERYGEDAVLAYE